MTTYNTGNPVGSTDPRDLSDNSENLDRFVNGEQPAYSDRLGQSRKSWAGMESEFAAFIAASGYEFLGDYAAGIEVTGYQQVVRDTNGEFWRVSGSTTLPYATTGAGLPEGGAFVAVGDAVLRQELAANTGAAMVGTSTGANVEHALSQRVIYVGSVGELEAMYLSAGTAVYLTQEGRAGEFVIETGTPPTDIHKGLYIVLANGNYAKRIGFDIATFAMFGISSGSASSVNLKDVLSVTKSLRATEPVEFSVRQDIDVEGAVIDFGWNEINFSSDISSTTTSGATPTDGAIYVTGSNVKISALKLNGSGNVHNGLWVEDGANDFLLDGYEIHNCGNAGVYTKQSALRSVLIKGLCYNNHNAVDSNSSGSVTFRSDGGEVDGLIVINSNGKGLSMRGNNQRFSNYFYDNLDMVDASGADNPLYTSGAENLLGNNIIILTQSYGPKISRGNDRIILNNIFCRALTGYAFRIQGGSNSVISNFHFETTGQWALRVSGHPLTNSACKNNVFQNGVLIGDSSLDTVMSISAEGTGEHGNNVFRDIVVTGGVTYLEGFGSDFGLPMNQFVNVTARSSGGVAAARLADSVVKGCTFENTGGGSTNYGLLIGSRGAFISSTEGVGHHGIRFSSPANTPSRVLHSVARSNTGSQGLFFQDPSGGNADTVVAFNVIEPTAYGLNNVGSYYNVIGGVAS